MNDMFPAEALEMLLNLLKFNSLNGWSTLPKHGKIYNCCLQQDISSHLALWNKVLSQLPKWKLFNKDTRKTSQTHQREIKIDYCIAWNSLKAVDLT